MLVAKAVLKSAISPGFCVPADILKDLSSKFCPTNVPVIVRVFLSPFFKSPIFQTELFRIGFYVCTGDVIARIVKSTNIKVLRSSLLRLRTRRFSAAGTKLITRDPTV